MAWALPEAVCCPCGVPLLQGVPAEEILVLTFSRRAAAEFRERLLRARVPSADAIEVATFHSWCGRDMHTRNMRVTTAEALGAGGASAALTAPLHSLPANRSWAVLRQHWREAGFERPPSIAASEEQLLGVMRDCVT